ncbi:MAG: HD domain-containing phosphohydrolase [Candidatus Omnitrophota bacterium]
MRKASFVFPQIIIICLGILLLTAILIVIGQIIYKRRVRTFWSLQNKLLARCHELESQVEKTYVPPSELEEKMWHEAETDFIFQLHEKIVTTFRREIVIKDIAQGVHNFINVNQTILLSFDKIAKELKVASAIGVDENLIKDFSLKSGEGISGLVIAQNKALQIDDLDKDSYLKKINKEGYLYGNFISIPIIFENNTLGVLNVCNKKNFKLFSKRDLSLLTNVGKVAAIALQNISLYEQINDNYLKTIGALALAIDARDPYTRFHSENVTRYSLAIADAMRMNSQDREVLRNAALLHDIGKIGIRDNILLKDTKLTDEEFEKIKSHPSKGEEMLKFLSFLKEASLIIRHHHERFDGAGYPDRIKGDGIELGARIIAAADTFDAMTTDRPYRKSLSLSEAIKELERCKGTQLDPEIVNVFIKVLAQNPNIAQS